MVVPAYSSYAVLPGFVDDFINVIAETHDFWRPQIDSDGVCRLEQTRPTLLSNTLPLPFLPAKKLILPPREMLWNYLSGQFCSAPDPQPLAICGVALCDLQAIWYLDQVFVEDQHYRARRAQTLLIGMPCEPGPECRCHSGLMPLAGDLFVTLHRAWALSERGEALLRESGCHTPQELPLPWPSAAVTRHHPLNAQQFNAVNASDFFAHEAKRCLSCGACSAVCPTCYCFDLLDNFGEDDEVCRDRVWDNCFFAEHGKVAGGHDFRAGRGARLRFRLEHKYLGFGALLGQNSCVGCGRCRNACPVDIDLDAVAANLVAEAAK